MTRSWRQVFGIKQDALARAAGVHVVTLSRIENGAEPRVGTAVALCRALSELGNHRVSVEDVFAPAPYDPKATSTPLDDAAAAAHRARVRADRTRRDW